MSELTKEAIKMLNTSEGIVPALKTKSYVWEEK